VDRTQGTCAATGAAHVSVTFAPREPAAFHKRVVCVVKVSFLAAAKSSLGDAESSLGDDAKSSLGDAKSLLAG
jgi:hypothetical protein